MERIGRSLEQMLRRLGVAEAARGWRAVDVWPEVAGPRVADRARAVAFRDGVLVVEVQSAAWMNELSFLRRRFVGELNRRLGESVVREIQLRPAGRGPAGRATDEPRPETQ